MYKLYRNESSIAAIGNRNTTFYRDTGPTKGILYEYRLEIFNGTGDSMGNWTTFVITGDVHGAITLDTTWTAATSPYNISGAVMVEENATLTIEKGATVDSGWPLEVYGTLSPLDTVTFNGGGIALSDVNGYSIKNCVFDGATGGSIGIALDRCNNCIIRGTVVKNYASHGIRLYGDNNTFTLTGNTASNNGGHGIFLSGDYNTLTLTGNTASNNSGHGIYLSGVINTLTLTGNTASNNGGSGICLGSLNNSMFTDNTASNNVGSGIDLGSSSNSMFTGNTASNNVGSGIDLGSSSNDNTFMDNVALNNGGRGIILGSSSNDNTFMGNTASNNSRGISLGSSSNSMFTDNTASNNVGSGIHLDSSSNNNLTGNTVSGNGYGISLGSSSNNNLAGNTVSGNGYGIYLGSSSNNNLAGNTVSSNDDCGIYLDYSSNNNSLTGNTASGNDYWGITLVCSNNNNLTGNTVSGNDYCGIYLDYSSNNNSITGNTASSNDYGIRLSSSSNNNITGNTASSNEGGIYLDYSSNNNNIAGNTANSNKYYGIRLSSASNNNITGNTASGNDGGIYLGYSSNNSLTGNIMSRNDYNFDVYGASLSHFIQNIDTSNLVNGKPVYYWVDQQDRQVPDDAGFVGIVNSTNITVRDLTLTNNSMGILFAYTNNSRVENVTASGNNYGIWLISSSNNNLTGNTVSGNDYCGIYLDYSSNNNNSITGNTVLGNDYGIRLCSSSNNNLTGNTISDNYYGILLSSSSNNSLTGNIMSGTNNNFDVSGYNLSHFIQNIDTSNLVNEKPVYYWVDRQDRQVPGDAGFVGIVNSVNITVRDLILINNTIGVLFAYTNNSRIENVTASGNNYGIRLYFSSNNNITGNIASENNHGIHLYFSSNSNLIYNNYFNNTNNVFDNGNNIWNITKTEGTNIIGGLYLGGNYWSDYAGEDLDGDGLGDTMLPYNSSGNIQNGGDWLPLVKPAAPSVFDTEPPENHYLIIMGTHKDEIKPSHNISISKLYTYSCAGTGGHTESIELYDENDVLIANGTWNGYKGDWHNITIHNLTGEAPYVTLLKDHKYNYTIVTGSYPQLEE